MSVQSEIDRLNAAKNALKAAIEEKGVPVPSDALLDSFAALVSDIKTPQNVVSYDRVEKTGSAAGEAVQAWEATCEQPCVCTIIAAQSVVRGSYGSLDGYIRKNGETLLEGTYRTDKAVSGGSYICLPLIVELAAGDTVRVWLHNSHYAKATLVLNTSSDVPIEFRRVDT